MDTDVIVVGAGPVGLMLAGELRLGGAAVVVVETLAAPTTESRASTLHARTMEILDQRGLLDMLGPVTSDPGGHFGGLPLDFGRLPSRYPGQWKVPQARVEAILAQWACGLGADLRRSHTLRDLTAAGEHVEATITRPGGTVTLRARYLVGCDGEHSTVRRRAGFTMAGTRAARELLRADLVGVEVPGRRFERHPDGLAIAATRDGVSRVMVHEFGRGPTDRDAAPPFEEIVRAWSRVTGDDLGAATPLWVNAFNDAAEQVTSYRLGRVLLAGDAAHVQMPVGGQALNLGLQDAANLGWKLAAQVRGWAPAGLLDTYHDERHAVGARVLTNVRAQAELLLGGAEVEPLRVILRELLTHETARAHLAGAVAGLDVRYPVGGANAHQLLGARLPHAGTPDRAAYLRSGRGVLLVLKPGSAGSGLRAVAAPWRDRVDTVLAEAVAGGPLGDLDAALVRPDGHVLWVSPGDVGLAAALRTWFGEPVDAPHRNHLHREEKPMSRLANKTALVTGASRGIGRGIAQRFGRDGAVVAVHYGTNRDAAERTVESITGAGGRAFAVHAELGVPGDVDQLFDALGAGLKEHAGREELDILVNNAGIMGGVAPEELTPELFDRLIAVNARAPLFITQRALTIMPDGGRIISISSGLTKVANPQEVAYAMSKGAIEMISLHYARHLGARGITVNSVAPGLTDNGSEIFDDPQARAAMAEFSVFKRVGAPADVADVVAFLASDDARWITGAFIDATGGTLLG